MTLSEADDFFGSKAFAGYRSTIESRQKLTLAILLRFDGVMKAIGGLGKLLASIGKRRGL